MWVSVWIATLSCWPGRTPGWCGKSLHTWRSGIRQGPVRSVTARPRV